MTERERILAMRDAYYVGWINARCDAGLQVDYHHHEHARREAAEHYPFPKRTVPTVRQGLAQNRKWWYRAFEYKYSCNVYRFESKMEAINNVNASTGWPLEDQLIVADLLTLSLTEEVEDDGND